MTFNQGHALLIGIGTYQNHPSMDVPVTQILRKIRALPQRSCYFAKRNNRDSSTWHQRAVSHPPRFTA